jgi:hypothetical protein
MLSLPGNASHMNDDLVIVNKPLFSLELKILIPARLWVLGFVYMGFEGTMARRTKVIVAN